MADFVHLHCHSEHSILCATTTTADLPKTAHAYGMPAIALTDSGNLFGAIDFTKKVSDFNKNHNAKIKPIYGCELTIAPPDFTSADSASFTGKTGHEIVLLCANDKGYHNLIKLVTLSYREGLYNGRPHVSMQSLEKYNDGLIALSGGYNGEVAKSLLGGTKSEAGQIVEKYRSIFGKDGFFLEIQNHNNPQDNQLITSTAELSKITGAGLVAATGSFYTVRDDLFTHEIFLCIRDGALISWEKGMGREKRPFLSGSGYHIKTPEEMHQDFRGLESALKNTLVIAEKCCFTLQKQPLHWPQFQISGSTSPFEYLRELSYNGLKKKIPNAGPEYTDRLEYELKVIEKMNFPTYFLIVQDIINTAKSFSMVGPGRGSAAGSLVSYATGITNPDPIQYTLLFERFLNPERQSMPDVDIDFQPNKRDQVIKYVRDTYGSDKICQIITLNRLKAKQVFKDVARVFGIDFNTANSLSKLIGDSKSLKETYLNKIEFKDIIQSSPLHQEIYRHSLKLEGLIRQTGVHAAGVIIADAPIEEYAPLYCDSDGTVCVQVEGSLIEEYCGLIKMDLLGLANLSTIDNAVQFVKEYYNEEIDIDRIPLNNTEVFELLSAGRCGGIFQFESEGMRKHLINLKPNSIHDLTAMCAMYRPGPMSWIPVYIDRKHRREIKFSRPEDEENYKKLQQLTEKCPQLKKILEPTNLIPIYQEQIIQIGRDVGGFSLGKADSMRRAMGKKKVEELIKIKQEFQNGARTISLTTAESDFLFEKIIMPFSGYGFNKSHAVCYAMLAYQTAYLKAKYPECFMTALLNSKIESTDEIKKYIEECIQLGITIIPPSINQSKLEFSIIGKKILYGLAAIKGVAGAAGSVIIANRTERGPFRDFGDFLRRVSDSKVNKLVIENLIKSGAFDEFNYNNEQLLHIYPRFSERVDQETRLHLGGQTSFFEKTHSSSTDADIYESALKMNVSVEKLKSNERDALGFSFRHDPAHRYANEFRLITTMSFALQHKWPDNQPITAAGCVSELSEITSKKGDKMAFVKLDNGAGTVRAVIFPRLFTKLLGDTPPELIQKDKLIIIKGKTQNNDKGVSIIADAINRFEPEKIPNRLFTMLHLEFLHEKVSHSQLTELKEILHTHYGGNCRICMHFKRMSGRNTKVYSGNNLTIIPGG